MPDSTPTLSELAGRLRASMGRADLARVGDQDAKAFTRLSAEVGKRQAQLNDAALFLGADACMTLIDEEEASLREAMRVARDAGKHAARILVAEPDALRTGPAWKAFAASAKTVGDKLYELRTEASKRLVADHPRPPQGAATTLVAGDPKRAEYAQALRDYDESLHETFESRAQVSRFIRSAERAQTLAEEIERRAVPEEHRERWALLVARRLPLDALIPDFRAWLDAEGHLTRVFAGLEDT
jgi:hypothetical protein